MSYTIAQDTIENTIKKELEFLRQQSEPFYIVQVEAQKEISINISVQGDQKTIHFKGYIDRIDKIGDRYRVIDYKSGKVTDSDDKFNVRNNDLQAAFTNCKHAVQLALYSLFFKDDFGKFPDEAIIYSLTDIQKLDYKLNYPKHNLADICVMFESFIGLVINDVFDSELAIEHNKRAKYCQYCS